jgi:hypothetical protein
MTSATPQVEIIPDGDGTGEGVGPGSSATASHGEGLAAGGPAGVDVSDPVARRRRLFRAELIPSLFFVVVGGACGVVSLGFSDTAKMLPLGASLVMFGLGGYELLKVLRGSGQDGEILDLGMRSSELGVERRTVALVGGLLLLFFFLAGIAGLQIAAVVFALVGPPLFMEGRQRWTSSLISGGFVLGFSEFMFRILGVIWPDPYILAWLGLV